MISSLLRIWSILVRIAQDVCGARDDFDLDLSDLICAQIVVLDGLHHCSQWSMAECFDWETFHAAINDSKVTLRARRQGLDQHLCIERSRFSLVLHMIEDSEETFFAIDNVLWSGVSVSSEQRTLCAHATRPRINGVLHVGQFSSSHRTRTESSRCTDAHRCDHLRWIEIEHTTRGDRRCKRAERCVMPTVFANAWQSKFTKSHFDFVCDDRRENKFSPAESVCLAQCKWRSDEITWMAGVGLPIDVVVIHRADHVSVEEGRIHGIRLETADK